MSARSGRNLLGVSWMHAPGLFGLSGAGSGRFKNPVFCAVSANSGKKCRRDAVRSIHFAAVRDGKQSTGVQAMSSNEVTTTIVAVRVNHASFRNQPTGISFVWRNKMRTLWFRNYDYPDGNKARTVRAAVGEYAKAVATTKIRKEVEHNIPGLRIFVTLGHDAKSQSFHIEKASGRPFDEGQLVYEWRYGGK